MGSAGSGIAASGHRSGQGIQATARRRWQASGLGRTPRRAAGSQRILVVHQGRRDRDHRDKRVRHRRHRWPGSGRAAAVLRPGSHAAARQHAGRGREQGRRTALVPAVGCQHPHRPQRAYRPRGAEGGRRGHLCRHGHARCPPHRRGRRAVRTADRRRTPPVADRNRLALRGARRAHRGPLGAQRPDRASCRTRPQERPRRPARRAAAQRPGHRPTRRRLPEPAAGLTHRHPR